MDTKMSIWSVIRFICFFQIGFVYCEITENNDDGVIPNQELQLQEGSFCFFTCSELIFDATMMQIAPSAQSIGAGKLQDTKIIISTASQSNGDHCYENLWGGVYTVSQKEYDFIIEYAQSRSQISFVSDVKVELLENKQSSCVTIDLATLPSAFPFQSNSQSTDYISNIDSYMDQLGGLGVPADYLQKLGNLINQQSSNQTNNPSQSISPGMPRSGPKAPPGMYPQNQLSGNMPPYQQIQQPPGPYSPTSSPNGYSQDVPQMSPNGMQPRGPPSSMSPKNQNNGQTLPPSMQPNTQGTPKYPDQYQPSSPFSPNNGPNTPPGMPLNDQYMDNMSPYPQNPIDGQQPTGLSSAWSPQNQTPMPNGYPQDMPQMFPNGMQPRGPPSATSPKNQNNGQTPEHGMQPNTQGAYKYSDQYQSSRPFSQNNGSKTPPGMYPQNQLSGNMPPYQQIQQLPGPYSPTSSPSGYSQDVPQMSPNGIQPKGPPLTTSPKNQNNGQTLPPSMQPNTQGTPKYPDQYQPSSSFSPNNGPNTPPGMPLNDQCIDNMSPYPQKPIDGQQPTGPPSPWSPQNQNPTPNGYPQDLPQIFPNGMQPRGPPSSTAPKNQNNGQTLPPSMQPNTQGTPTYPDQYQPSSPFSPNNGPNTPPGMPLNDQCMDNMSPYPQKPIDGQQPTGPPSPWSPQNQNPTPNGYPQDLPQIFPNGMQPRGPPSLTSSQNPYSQNPKSNIRTPEPPQLLPDGTPSSRFMPQAPSQGPPNGMQQPGYNNQPYPISDNLSDMGNGISSSSNYTNGKKPSYFNNQMTNEQTSLSQSNQFKGSYTNANDKQKPQSQYPPSALSSDNNSSLFNGSISTKQQQSYQAEYNSKNTQSMQSSIQGNQQQKMNGGPSSPGQGMPNDQGGFQVDLNSPPCNDPVIPGFTVAAHDPEFAHVVDERYYPSFMPRDICP